MTTGGKGVYIAQEAAPAAPDVPSSSDQPSSTALEPEDSKPIVPKTKGLRTSSATFSVSPSLGSIETDAMKVFLRSVARHPPSTPKFAGAFGTNQAFQGCFACQHGSSGVCCVFSSPNLYLCEELQGVKLSTYADRRFYDLYDLKIRERILKKHRQAGSASRKDPIIAISIKEVHTQTYPASRSALSFACHLCLFAAVMQHIASAGSSGSFRAHLTPSIAARAGQEGQEDQEDTAQQQRRDLHDRFVHRAHAQARAWTEQLSHWDKWLLDHAEVTPANRVSCRPSAAVGASSLA